MQTQSTSSGVSALTGRFLGFGGLDLLDVAVAANQQPCAECDEHRHGDPAAPQQEQCHAKAIRNPPSAVMNHPATTVITPVMRYTALSRPQVRSASDEPIATMKQT